MAEDNIIGTFEKKKRKVEEACKSCRIVILSQQKDLEEVVNNMSLSNKDLLEMYKKMLKIRKFEEATIELYKEGIMPGLAHPYIGEEAIAVGVCSNLEKNDYIASTHRGHGHLIAKGGDLKTMMAEILGKKTGYCKGKGGSMHIADFNLGILGANGIVGGGLTLATGAGLASSIRKSNQVSVCFFGDGASNQGTVHESINLASVWKLPVIYVCENNGYGISVSQKNHQNIENISDRAAAYGIPGYSIDGNDVEAVYYIFEKAAIRAREGAGPSFIECKTYRWTGHHVGDPGNGINYRTQEEMDAWKKKCPIAHIEKKLLKEKSINEDKMKQISEEIRAEVMAAVEYAKASPLPEPDEVFDGLFA